MIRLMSPLIALTLVALPARGQSKFPFHEPVSPPRAVQVMVHRGMAMLAPENSVRAVRACADDYLEWAEIDVRLSSDGRHVVIHDDALGRCTNGTGRVSSLTLSELLKLDAGSKHARRFNDVRLAALSEMLEAAKGRVNLCIDCKEVDHALLCREIINSGMGSQVVVYDSPGNLRKIRSISGSAIATMVKYRPVEDLAGFIATTDPSVVEIDADDVTSGLCAAFHSRGIKVQAKVLGAKWDNKATWARVIDSGADWLQTDDPAGVRFLDARRRIGKFPVMIAMHRGASRYAPENTIAAIDTAAGLGADYIEIDIRTTRDGRHMLLHDSQLSRTTTGMGAISDAEWDDVRRLSAGDWFGSRFTGQKVPSLTEGLDALGTSSAYLDAKAIAPGDLAKAIRQANLLDRHVVYQSVDYGKKLLEIEPRARMLPPMSKLAELESVAAIKPYGVDARWNALSKEFIDACHARGIRVFSDALGFNETIGQYRQKISWGIDCIQTDYPLRLLRAIELNAGKAD